MSIITNGMKLIIVRHGETEENAKHLIQGHLPGKLSKKGIRQARKVASALKNEKIDAIFSSDLGRSKSTCREISKYHSVPIRYTKKLRKSSAGIYTGKPKSVIRCAYLSAYAKGISKITFKPEGGESILEVKRRIMIFVNHLYPRYKYKSIVLVTHGEVAGILMHIHNRIPISDALRAKPGCGEIVRIKVRD